jgi:hypothetical protein
MQRGRKQPAEDVVIKYYETIFWTISAAASCSETSRFELGPENEQVYRRLSWFLSVPPEKF